jgi:[ribosomal protein S18]-alanine N-acetyltransferase
VNLRLALAGPRDVPTMGRIMEGAFDPRFGEAWSTAQLAGALGIADTWGQLGYDDELPYGFSLTRRVIDEAELMLVAVLPVERGRGLGRRLVEGALHKARQRGARKMFLEVRDGNLPAFRLYESLGFSVAGRRQNYYTGANGERFDAVTMRRNLG